MTFDPYNLPDGFPSDGVQEIQRKPYITHVGLVWLANHRGKPWSSTIDHIERQYGDDGWPTYVEVTVTISDGEISHTAMGDATRNNVGRNIVPHFVRMAHTRAMNRALRSFCGYAGCTADELGQYDEDPTFSGSSGAQMTHAPMVENGNAQPRDTSVQNRAPRSAKNGDPSCPHCGSMVYDNRGTAKGKQPLFVCSAGERCTGAKKKGDKIYAWSSWDVDWWDKQLHDIKMMNADNQKVDVIAGNLAESMVLDGQHQDEVNQREEPPFFSDEDIPY
ncbi:MAG: hypothetical protein Unbinned4118contig1001_8 [Prokaryotic dsDNA virus sp.]|jgi:hypothetical protein|nr:MAG: hypothetical protein Unbinned4118contig1001_8 [Prokaryotic dsDNA virus sp.]